MRQAINQPIEGAIAQAIDETPKPTHPTASMGLAVVAVHNDWKWHWSLIITVIGWLALIGGAVRMIAPQVIETYGLAVLSSPNFFIIDGAIAVLLGVLLSYFGYLDPPQLVHESTRRQPRVRRRK